MRPHGRARTNAMAPRAHAICQRCGFEYNLTDLQFQWDWQQGPRLRNLMIQVCPSCLDEPQQSGRTIILPPDPVAKAFPLPEDYAHADNPLSPLGFNVANNSLLPQSPQGAFGNFGKFFGNFGNMTHNGGVDAAFDGIVNKGSGFCSALSVSSPGLNNFVGKNWNGYPSGIALTMPSTTTPVSHIASSFILTAPNDAPFLRSPTGVTNYTFSGSQDGVTFTVLLAANTAGGVGEVVTASLTSTVSYQFHGIVLNGDGISTVAIAQLAINVSDAAPNDI